MSRFDIEQLLRELDDTFGIEESSSEVVEPSENPEVVVDSLRPPDFISGDGLGEVIDPTPAVTEATVRPTRPDDALRDVYVPEVDGEIIESDLVEALLQAGHIDSEQAEQVRRVVQQSPDRPLLDVITDLDVDEALVQELVAKISRIPFMRIETENVDAEAVQRIGMEYCQERLVLPLRTEGTRACIATTSPDDVFLLDEVKRRMGISVVKHILVTRGDIHQILTLLDRNIDRVADVEAILADVDEDDVEVEKQESESSNLEAEAESSPVVRYVNHIIQTALKDGASDIHIEPGESVLRVRMRIDGVLYEAMTPPRKMHAALTSRVKIMANLDIAERRLPQDGRIRASVMGRKIDLRVSTVPTPYGEKTVMRILDDRAIQVSLDQLGFAEDTYVIWEKQISQPHGIILVTGPTGSGKTTTLYSSIRQMDMKRLNISTVEDPVEYNLPGITQIQTHSQIDMTFGRALKALLRQDPDVVMVGEIRDKETASTAIQAALTGHLVLSTLHTNDAPSSVTRLINMGAEPFLVGAALNAVLAQRLVRKICPECSVTQPIPEEMVEFLGMHGIGDAGLPIGSGCDACRHTGYSGRLGLYEMLVLDDHLRDQIASSPNVTEFRRLCCERGMVTLREDGFEKVKSGRTTVEEVMRVTEATI